MPRQNTAPSDYPQTVIRQIEQLAHNIVIARKRRGESQAQWAKKLGISQPTMARIERGDPSVAMASYVMCIWLINPVAVLADLIAPASDHAALEKEVAKAVRGRRPVAAQKAPALKLPSLKYETVPVTVLRAAEPGKRSAATAGLHALMAQPGNKPSDQPASTRDV